jgi:hypothetical protein
MKGERGVSGRAFPPPTGSESPGSRSKINHAIQNVHKEPTQRGAPPGPKGMASPMAQDHGLKGAVDELLKQHPIAHHDHGPHHGTDHHIRHQPLHGLHSSHDSGYGASSVGTSKPMMKP